MRVDEPTVEDTISILRGLRERYELHHGVRIKDAALVAAAIFSNRYITDRFLPDKAIDLVDEAGARLRTEIDSMPADLDETRRRIMQLEIEREALRKEKDKASKERLSKLEKELANLKAESDALMAQWQAEKDAVQRCALREQVEQIGGIAQAERQYDLNRAAELNTASWSLRSNWRRRTKVRQAAGPAQNDQGRGGREDIAAVVSRWTGVPVTKLLEGEMQKLLHLEAELHQRVSGRRSGNSGSGGSDPRVQLKDPDRPVGSFIFLARRAWGRRNWRGRWRRFCSTTNAP